MLCVVVGLFVFCVTTKQFLCSCAVYNTVCSQDYNATPFLGSWFSSTTWPTLPKGNVTDLLALRRWRTAL